jgi:predicted  nucleic acid-binding Zn-ribbon protein
LKVYEDSLSKISDTKIDLINKEINSKKSKIEDKDKEQTNIESSVNITYQQKNRIKDLKSEKSELKSDIVTLENKIKEEQEDLQSKIKNFESKSNEDALSKKSEKSDNSFFLSSYLL